MDRVENCPYIGELCGGYPDLSPVTINIHDPRSAGEEGTVRGVLVSLHSTADQLYDYVGELCDMEHNSFTLHHIAMSQSSSEYFLPRDQAPLAMHSVLNGDTVRVAPGCDPAADEWDATLSAVDQLPEIHELRVPGEEELLMNGWGDVPATEHPHEGIDELDLELELDTAGELLADSNRAGVVDEVGDESDFGAAVQLNGKSELEDALGQASRAMKEGRIGFPQKSLSEIELGLERLLRALGGEGD